MKKVISIVAMIVPLLMAQGQGCSDAGICSVGKSFENDSLVFKNSLEWGSQYAKGDADVSYVAHFLSYTKRFNARFAFSAKVTLSTATGSFGTRTQFGDAILVGNYHFRPQKKQHWSALLGLKFPFTASNLKINGFSLPLDYQSSLGTIDAFLGVNWRVQRWDFNTVWQIPLVNLNKNSYFREYGGTNDFVSTNLFERQPDALVKVSYTQPIPNSRWSIKPNLIAIYHLGEDSFENIFGQREKIQGSSGLTVNANVNINYVFNTSHQIDLALASPFVVRDVRPDGLTRSLVINLVYQYSF
ncbi:hypothetical protein SAMN05444377_1148 [Flavobacterium fontis]|uniref:MetA-pathway of phenol degradation n=1 Tax=Flavobacterium fontis TaxID=1124188 RepID=A0A1M5D690_9FLAO|nr:hypothetical protein [Flavobacterium fontis]SHF62370.1 hypothetical protein SAMN05444377_1148 [Flavobacterium fontis]